MRTEPEVTMYPFKPKKGALSSGGGYIIFAAVAAVLAYGVSRGLRIDDSILEPGSFISNSLGYASREPGIITLYCRYLTWSGIEERVYPHRFDDPMRHNYCPLLLQQGRSDSR
jgi:hypothetical protein